MHIASDKTHKDMNGIIKIFVLILLLGSLQACNRPAKLPLDKWEYVLIDSTRTHYDVFTGWQAWFGMDFADGNHDGYGDIVAGKWFYLNPGADMKTSWKRSTVKDTVDNMFIVDVDNDIFPDVIGLSCNIQYWFEATDSLCTKWKKTIIGNESICNHKMSSMGYCKADIFKVGKHELIFTDLPGKVWCFEIPENPESLWPVTIITENGSTDKSISAADVDGDGDIDLVTGCQYENEKFHFKGVCWLENPGKKEGNWQQHKVGSIDYIADHFAAADFNRDGHCEILVTESRAPEKYPAGIYLFTAPKGDVKATDWEKKQLVVQNSTNSLDIADMDKDGDIDFVTGEHKGSCKLQIWENDGLANFRLHNIDSLKESHNGTKLFDIDGDGDMDIVTAGWYNYKDVHLWINKSIN